MFLILHFQDIHFHADNIYQVPQYSDNGSVRYVLDIYSQLFEWLEIYISDSHFASVSNPCDLHLNVIIFDVFRKSQLLETCDYMRIYLSLKENKFEKKNI